LKHLALLVAAGVMMAPCANAQETTPRPVISEILQNVPARMRSFPGTIAAEVESVLAFQTAGRVATRPVDLGNRVKTGDVLATLDQITLADDVAAARATLSAAKAEADLARQTLERTEKLNRSGVTATANLETALAERDSTAAALLAAKADLARAEDAERYSVLRASQNGVIIATSVEPGSVVAAGTAVVTLAADDRLEAVINVPPEILSVLPDNASFLVRSRVAGSAPVPGRLRLVEPVADSNTRSRRVRISLTGKNSALRIGSLVLVAPDLPETPILSVPKAAVVMRGENAQVWRIDPETRKAEAVGIVLGPTFNGRIVVTEGLKPGDEILVRGVNSVTEGQTLGPKVE